MSNAIYCKTCYFISLEKKVMFSHHLFCHKKGHVTEDFWCCLQFNEIKIKIQYKSANWPFVTKYHNLTSVSKKPGQAIVLYHYCSLSRFFWNRRTKIYDCLHTTGLLRHQRPQKDNKRPKNSLVIDKRPNYLLNYSCGLN